MSLQEKILLPESDTQPSSAQDSPASRTVLQENVGHLVMNVTLQENSKESFGKLNPDGSLLRMSQGYAQANLDGFLESSCMTFPKWGILSDGVVGRPSMLEHVIGENGSSLLLTPSATNIEGGPDRAAKRTKYRESIGRHWVAGGLAEQIMMIPTITCNTGKNTSPGINFDKREQKCHLDGVFMNQLGKKAGLQLQPAFAEWMMGFPPEWTALSASEMPLSRSKSIRSSKQSQTLKEE